jgi:hypothetical protein
MKKILFFVWIVLIVKFSLAQNVEEFYQKNNKTTLPYSMDYYDFYKCSKEFALNYICDGDSSALYWKVVSVNHDTGEVGFRKTIPFPYKVYAIYKLGNYYVLVYNVKHSKKAQDFTFLSKIGLFTEEGKKLDEKDFYINDDLGKYENQRATINKPVNKSV